MAWYVWVILLVVTYFLGLLGAKYFQKTHPPDRRKAERRQGDRRSGAHATPPGGVERRQTDRRSGRDRRRPKPLWQLATVVVAGALLSLIGVMAYAESQVASIFAETQPELTGAGWANCDTPITWSLDTSRLTPADESVAVQQLTDDFAKWGAASGLKFQYTGEVPVQYDDKNYVVTSDQHPSDRHIYVAFLRDSESSLLDTRTVGFASPTKVWLDNRNITEGSVVLSIDYVKKVNKLHASSMYLHELGHALGLAHGTDKPEVMYPIVDTTNELSPQDIAGIRALTQVCAK